MSRAGRPDKVFDEVRGYFLGMADKTGTLWEHDNFSAHVLSFNHHMLSCFVSVFISGILGLKAENKKVVFDPVKNIDIKSASGSLGRGKNKVKVSIIRGTRIYAEISVPKDGYVVYKGKYLPKGISKIEI